MSLFLDTSVLLAGSIDFGPQSAPAQSLLHAVAEKRVPPPTTAWHYNRRHFMSALRYGMRVETPAECLAALKARRP